jgi:hypothetical protein
MLVLGDVRDVALFQYPSCNFHVMLFSLPRGISTFPRCNNRRTKEMALKSILIELPFYHRVMLCTILLVSLIIVCKNQTLNSSFNWLIQIQIDQWKSSVLKLITNFYLYNKFFCLSKFTFIYHV